MALARGSRLGPYEILAQLGAGGMGEVYRAQDTRLDRIVAIKLLPQHLSRNQALRERLEREARAVSRLNHPHICTLYDIGHQDGIDFLVMEYLEGETLAARLERGPLPVDQVLRFAIEIAGALEFAHRQGVVHRDLKPGNLMLVRSGGKEISKLLDFGLAKAVLRKPDGGSGSSEALTQSLQGVTAEGTIVGTVQYMSPEQLEGREDARSDLFAFGAVLFEMVTGRRAFTGKSPASVIAAIMTAEPPAMASANPDVAIVPPMLEQVVRTCLVKDAGERWQSAHDVLEVLRWIAAGDAPAGPGPAHARPRKVWLAGLAAAGLVALAATGVALWSLRRPPADATTVRFAVPPPRAVQYNADRSEGPLTVSPDGGSVTFAGVTASGRQLLWVRRVDALEAEPLAGTDGGFQPFWSPDSQNIGFFAGGKLKRIAASGGPVQTLCDAPEPRGANWGRGDILFSPSIRDPIYKVPAAGGAPAPVTKLDAGLGEVGHRWPQFLPDERYFLYLARGAQPGHAVWAMPLAGGEKKRVLQIETGVTFVPERPGATSGHLLYVRLHSLVAQRFDAYRLQVGGDPQVVAEQVGNSMGILRGAFSVSQTGVLAYGSRESEYSELVWFDRHGRQLGTVGGSRWWEQPALSPDETTVAVGSLEARDARADVWLIDLKSGASTRITSDPSAESRPVWAPDGKRIAFAANRAAVPDIYMRPAKGSGGEERLLSSSTFKHPSDWSPDGSYLLYEDYPAQTRRDIWALRLADRKPVPIATSEANERQPRFSPDGRWIAYASDESGTWEVYVVPFPASGPAARERVSSGGGSQPRWRRDGKELFYISADRKMMAVPIRIGAGALDAADPRVLFETRTAPMSAMSAVTYEVSGDGQRFLVATLPDGEQAAAAILMLNWRAVLKP